jgi:hypothetical protein
MKKTCFLPPIIKYSQNTLLLPWAISESSSIQFLTTLNWHYRCNLLMVSTSGQTSSLATTLISGSVTLVIWLKLSSSSFQHIGTYLVLLIPINFSIFLLFNGATIHN